MNVEAYRENARRFMTEETQFHLGALVTEQPHPRTTGLAEILRRDTSAGIKMLQDVDRDVARAAGTVFNSAEFAALAAALQTALLHKRKIFFSGCGATGRLCILIEAAWRRCCARVQTAHPALAGRLPFGVESVVSIMTGGDFALVRSVEFFEDFAAFGQRQARDAGVGAEDVFVGISEGGETSSVIGSLHQALDVGAKVFFVYNNPGAVLSDLIERSRQVIRQPGVTNLELVSGPMAVAGSTRMQATTFELLVVGAALELALAAALQTSMSGADAQKLGIVARAPSDYATRFDALLDDLAAPTSRAALRDWVEFEQELYQNGGLVTYMACDFLLDIFTDTTERSPTFMLPPFRKCDDLVSSASWTFVKHPAWSTPDAWRDALRRPPRCLNWTAADYRALGAPAKICDAPPRLDAGELQKIQVGNEPDASRLRAPWDAAMAVLVGAESRRLAMPADVWTRNWRQCAAPFQRQAAVCIGAGDAVLGAGFTAFNIPCALPDSPLDLWHHLAVKLALNTVSTVTMGRLGRLIGNWMAFVDTTNKKLIDRGTRLVSELCGLDYAPACMALHETIGEMEKLSAVERKTISAVARTIERLGRAGDA